MKPVSELFKNRPTTLWSLGPDDSVFEAIKVLAEKGVGALMVMELSPRSVLTVAYEPLRVT